MIAATNLTMRFGERTLFEDVSVKFKPEIRYGLIGANGVGKSTFMKILSGQIKSTKGDIAIDRDCTLGYLKQDHYEYDNEVIIDTVLMGNDPLWALHKERDDLYSKDTSELSDKENERMMVIEEEYGEAGGYTMDADAAKLLRGLGIPDEKHYEPMSSLTGGFKLRVLLAQVLFANPDILLLDEPTNHLDMASIDWLVNFLCRHHGTVIVISHDRHFLNSVCTQIADLDYQELRLFPGNYDDFMIANEMALDRQRKDNEKKERQIAELKSFINRFGANASKAKQTTSRKKLLDKIEIDKIKPSSRVSPHIRFNPLTDLGVKVFEVDEVAKKYEYKLFENYSATFANDEKIAILGKNGVGKTTLLKIITKMIEPDKGDVIHGETVEVSYFPQDASDMISGDIPAIDWLSRHSPDDTVLETEIRGFMGKMLFRKEDVFKQVNVLSGGEKARLIIAKMMLEGGNVLIFDEPTNHLDLEAIEALNFALTLVDKTVIFVSHDREFINSLATRIIEIEDGQITDYRGTFSEFESWKRQNKKKAKS